MPRGRFRPMHLGRVGLWTFQLDLQPASAAQEAAAELEELGYPAMWLPEAVGREPFVNSALLLSATQPLIVATGIASVWARDAHDDGRRPADPERGLPRSVPPRPRREPPADGRLVRGHHYDKPLTKMRDLPRGDGQRDLRGAPARGGAAPGAGGARAEDARAGGGQGPRRPPVLRAGGAHRLRPGGARGGPDAVPRAGGRARHGSPRRPGRGPAAHGHLPRPAQLHEQPAAPRVGRRRPRATAAATRSSTPSSPGATRTPSSPGSRPTSTPGPTTCASRCSTRDAAALPMAQWRALAPALGSLA